MPRHTWQWSLVCWGGVGNAASEAKAAYLATRMIGGGGGGGGGGGFTVLTRFY